MQKRKSYTRTRFSADVLREAIEILKEISHEEGAEVKGDRESFFVKISDEEWYHDNLEEFFSDYRQATHARWEVDAWRDKPYQKVLGLEIVLNGYTKDTTIAVFALKRATVQRLFEARPI